MHFNRQTLKLITGWIAALLSLTMPRVALAQGITNVDANQEGKAIAVTYDLDEMANISLYVTQDGGVTKTEIPLMYTSGDVGKKVGPGREKKILWRVLDQYPNQNFQGENMSFIVKGRPAMRFFTMLNAGYSFDSGFNTGLTIGQFGFIGWYAKFMTTLAFAKPADYECDENGSVDGVFPAYSGMACKAKAYGVAGVTIRMGAPIYFNAGVGYGGRNYAWETIEGKWVKNLPGSYNGLVIDAGLMGKINNIALSLGATLLRGSVDISVGVGYVF